MIRFKNNRGDTLVEVTIAMAIVSVVIASSFNLVNGSFRFGQIARQRTEAASIMQAEAETLRNQRDATLSAGEGSPSAPTSGWNSFVAKYVPSFAAGTPATLPDCKAVSPNPIYATVQPPASVASLGGDTWTPVTGTPVPAPATSDFGGTATKYTSVTTQQGTYATWIQLCSLDAFDRTAGYGAFSGGSGGEDPFNSFDLRFTIFLQWQGPGGNLQTANLVTELADVGSMLLQPLANSIDTTPVTGALAQPAIISFSAYGSIASTKPTSNDPKAYDSSQCTDATMTTCERINFNWQVSGTPTPTCVISGGNLGVTTYTETSLAGPQTAPASENLTTSNESLTYNLNCSSSSGPSKSKNYTLHIIACPSNLSAISWNPFLLAGYSYGFYWHHDRFQACPPL